MSKDNFTAPEILVNVHFSTLGSSVTTLARRKTMDITNYLCKNANMTPKQAQYTLLRKTAHYGTSGNFGTLRRQLPHNKTYMKRTQPIRLRQIDRSNLLYVTDDEDLLFLNDANMLVVRNRCYKQICKRLSADQSKQIYSVFAEVQGEHAPPRKAAVGLRFKAASDAFVSTSGGSEYSFVVPHLFRISECLPPPCLLSDRLTEVILDDFWTYYKGTWLSPNEMFHKYLDHSPNFYSRTTNAVESSQTRIRAAFPSKSSNIDINLSIFERCHGNNDKEFRIEISRPDEFEFLFAEGITRGKFQNLAKTWGLNVNFEDFPKRIIRLLKERGAPSFPVQLNCTLCQDYTICMEIEKLRNREDLENDLELERDEHQAAHSMIDRLEDDIHILQEDLDCSEEEAEALKAQVCFMFFERDNLLLGMYGSSLSPGSFYPNLAATAGFPRVISSPLGSSVSPMTPTYPPRLGQSLQLQFPEFYQHKIKRVEIRQRAVVTLIYIVFIGAVYVMSFYPLCCGLSCSGIYFSNHLSFCSSCFLFRKGYCQEWMAAGWDRRTRLAVCTVNNWALDFTGNVERITRSRIYAYEAISVYAGPIFSVDI
uniref:SAS-6_N domain-containing protein n=2 Tax=Heterorhabditis bacteriophora TaxID=37862 RepID=A0A1I7X066_HETBA